MPVEAIAAAAVLSDEEVVQRVRQGQPELFELLMRRHNRKVYRAVRSVLSQEDAVEDVMQQAYLNAYAHLHQFEGRSTFSTWLIRIAVHEAFACRRRQGPGAGAAGNREEQTDVV